MKTLVRWTLVLGMVVTLGVSLAAPAVAGRRIGFKGRTSQDEPLRFEILKRDSGRRVIHSQLVFFTLTCEDASTEFFGFEFNSRERLADDGSFTSEETFPGVFGFRAHMQGVVRWASAEGTFQVDVGGLTEEGEPQLCTTGLLDWSAHRVRSRPAQPSATPDGVTMLRVGRDGALRVLTP